MTNPNPKHLCPHCGQELEHPEGFLPTACDAGPTDCPVCNKPMSVQVMEDMFLRSIRQDRADAQKTLARPNINEGLRTLLVNTIAELDEAERVVLSKTP